MNERVSGTVKWFNDAKRVRVYCPRWRGSDVFVHYSAVAGEGFKSLAEGQRVEFRIEQGPKGVAAAEVRKVETGS